MPSIIDDLKRAFSAGNIPSEKDFTTLIDLASRPNSLLGINEQGEAEAILNGLIVANNQLAISLAKDSGLNLVDNKLAVKAGAGININDTDGIFLKAESGSGIKIDKGIISVDPWPGVVLDDEKHLKANLGKGLKLVDNAVNLDLSDGLVVDDTSKKLAVKVLKDGAKDNTSGLVLGKDGLKINISPDGNNIEIDKTTGSLKLTQEALTTLKEGSRSKFISALQTAQEASAKLTPPALDEKDPVTLTIDAQGNQEEWQGPLERLINKANSFGQNEVVRARESLEEQIKVFIKTQDPRPTNNNIRMNFSMLDYQGNSILRWGPKGGDIFHINEAYAFNSNKEIRMAKDLDDTAYNFNITNFINTGFYAFIGKLDKPGQEGKDDKEGKEITPNAILVHITEKLVYAVGYWDLTTDNLEWYKFETDPSTNIITRKVEELKIEPFTMKVDDKVDQLKISGGDGTNIISTINKFEDKFSIDKYGNVTPHAWTDKVEITASQPASRTKNGTNLANVGLTVEPIENIKFEEQKITHKYADIAKKQKYNFEIKGGNPESSTQLQTQSGNKGATFQTSEKPFYYTIYDTGNSSLEGHQASTNLKKQNTGVVLNIIVDNQFITPVISKVGYNEGKNNNGQIILFFMEKPKYGSIFLNYDNSRIHSDIEGFKNQLDTKIIIEGERIVFMLRAKYYELHYRDYYGDYCFYCGNSPSDFNPDASNVFHFDEIEGNYSGDIFDWPS